MPGNRSDPELLAELRRHARTEDDFEMYVGSGWLPLVRECHTRLRERFPDYELLAIKEKYGELAYQAFPHPWRQGGAAWTKAEHDFAEEVTEQARLVSTTVCERCGRVGTTRFDRRHVLTLCDAHHDELTDPPLHTGGARFYGLYEGG